MGALLIPRSPAWPPRLSSVKPWVLLATAGPQIKAQRPGWGGQSGQRVREGVQQRRFLTVEAWAWHRCLWLPGGPVDRPGAWAYFPQPLPVPVLGTSSREPLTTSQQQWARNLCLPGPPLGLLGQAPLVCRGRRGWWGWEGGLEASPRDVLRPCCPREITPTPIPPEHQFPPLEKESIGLLTQCLFRRPLRHFFQFKLSVTQMPGVHRE